MDLEFCVEYFGKEIPDTISKKMSFLNNILKLF